MIAQPRAGLEALRRRRRQRLQSVVAWAVLTGAAVLLAGLALFSHWVTGPD